jgi:hypothetical protein
LKKLGVPSAVPEREKKYWQAEEINSIATHRQPQLIENLQVNENESGMKRSPFCDEATTGMTERTIR